MKPVYWVAALAMACVVGGCARTSEPAPEILMGMGNQGRPFAPLSLTEAPEFINMNASLRVENIRVSVPDNLLVSEANSYYPRADIVWRGDPPGNRHDQIRKIFQAAAEVGTQTLTAGHAVVVEIEVVRFHSLTEKTRYTVGGVHSIRFDIALRSAETGATLAPPQRVKADLKGFGGQKAIDAERQGLTQKKRITDHLSAVIAAQLGTRVSHMQSAEQSALVGSEI